MKRYRIIRERDRSFSVQVREGRWFSRWKEAGSPRWPHCNVHLTAEAAEDFIKQHASGVWSEMHQANRPRVVAEFCAD